MCLQAVLKAGAPPRIEGGLPAAKKDSSCSCDDSLAVIVQKEYQSVSKQINNHAFSSSPSINCTISGTFLKIQNINENDLAKLELLVPSYQNNGVNFIISLAAVKVVLIDLTPNADVSVAGLNQIMNNYIQYNEARHESSVGKFKPFTYDVNDSKFNKSVPQITDTLSEVDVHCLTTYGHVKNYDIVLVFSNEGARGVEKALGIYGSHPDLNDLWGQYNRPDDANFKEAFNTVARGGELGFQDYDRYLGGIPDSNGFLRLAQILKEATLHADAVRGSERLGNRPPLISIGSHPVPKFTS